MVVCAKHRRQGHRPAAHGPKAPRGDASHGAVEVVLTTWVGNDEAEAFYERLGYRVLSRVLYAPISRR